jgi:hypothetical protein
VNEPVNSICQHCGRSKPVAFAQYNSNIGMGFRRREQSTKGYFCAHCNRVLFSKYFFTCLGLGWFGLISFITNPFRLIFDIYQYARAEIRLGGMGRDVVYSCVAIIAILLSLLIYHSFNNPMHDLQALVNPLSTQLEERISSASSAKLTQSQSLPILVIWTETGTLCTGVQKLIPVSDWPKNINDINNGYLISITKDNSLDAHYGSTYPNIDGYTVNYDCNVYLSVIQNGKPVLTEVNSIEFPGGELPDSISVDQYSTAPYYGSPPSYDSVADWINTSLVSQSY